MDNHPIPQDVTGFQFKLIGNMTVKQFAYLAGGVIFAWILWQLPNVNVLIKLPLCAISSLLGTGFAYFPISGRPMDVMIGNYIKALFRPTEFVYEKVGGQIYFPNRTPLTTVKNLKQYKNNLGLLPQDKLKAYLESMPTKPKDKLDEKENSFLASVSNLSTNNFPNQPILQPVAATPPPPPPVIPSIKPQSQQRDFNKTVSKPSVPEFPNLITGTTKDPRGNALSNILVEVKDKDGNPVRAFKTNEFGRFASATPLANGTYAIEFEDPKAQNKFEKIAINVTGQIILPIEAISVDTREELRRSLFTSNTKVN